MQCEQVLFQFQELQTTNAAAKIAKPGGRGFIFVGQKHNNLK